MRTFLVVVFLAFFIHIGYTQKTILINGEGMQGFKIEGITSFNLHNPGDNFEKLQAFGNLIDSSYTKTFVDETYVLVFNGIKLTYVDINGRPELTEMILYGNNIQLDLNDYKVQRGMVPVELLNQTNNARSNLSIEYDSDKPQAKKYGKYFSYLEISLNEKDSTIDKIVYKHSIL